MVACHGVLSAVSVEWSYEKSVSYTHLDVYKRQADILCGDANPSGHISDTYAVNSLSAPSMVNFGIYTYSNSSVSGEKDGLTETDKADWFEVESEGIYNGYKYYETRYEDCVLGKLSLIHI